MDDKDIITTQDINVVAKIHSDPQYANWKYEYVDGVHKFYPPNYKKKETIIFYHGGAEPDFDISKLDVLRKSQKQQTKSNNYAGFYMYGEQDYESAIKYAKQENSIKNTTTKGVVKITMSNDLKVYQVPPFSITRIPEEQIKQLQQQGYDIIAGRMLGKTEYVLLNKDKILNMEFQRLEEKKEETYVPLEQLEPLLSEKGYMCLGHGTGRKGNDNSVVDSIFSNGLRTKDNSLYFTTIGLSTPTPEIIQQYQELGIPIPTISDLKNQFNNWQHQDSKKIIIARIPTEYINMTGDRSDLDGEMYGAFMKETVDENGKKTSYLNPKFIVGCFDVEKQMVKLNNMFEQTLSQETIEELKSGYKKALEKTRDRIKRNETFSMPNVISESTTITPTTNFDTYEDFDFPDIDWEDTNSPKMGK